MQKFTWRILQKWPEFLIKQQRWCSRRRTHFGRPQLVAASPRVRFAHFRTMYCLILLMVLCHPAAVQARLLDTAVACDQHNFILTLNFDLPFRGLVYSEEGYPNCVYVNGTVRSQLNYQLKVPLHGCETHVNADGNFENGIIIQEHLAFLQSTDKKYLLTCIPSTNPPAPPAPPSTTIPTTTATKIRNPEILDKKNGLDPLPAPMESLAFGRENAVTVDFGRANLDHRLDHLPTSTELARGTLPTPLVGSSADANNDLLGSVTPAPPPSVVPELKYSVEIRAGHAADAPPISSALNIGDQISYVVRLQKPISESQIGKCWASDAKSSLELSDEHGCSLQPRGNIWGQFERVETESELVFINRIKAWAFPTSNEVNIFCNLRICMSKRCSFVTNCTTPLENATAQRRRRHHEGKQQQQEFMTEVETLKTHIHVRRAKRHSWEDRPWPTLISSADHHQSHFAAMLLLFGPLLWLCFL